MIFALGTRDDPAMTSVRVLQDSTLEWVLLGIIKYFLLIIIYIVKLIRTLSIIWPLLPTAHFITVAIAIAIITKTFALGEIGVG